MSPPNVIVVSAQVAIKIEALGAAALAHSASRIASVSLGAITPGLRQLFTPVGGAGYMVLNEPELYFERPKVERKVFQSVALKMSVSSMTATVGPCPEKPGLKRGFKLKM